MRSLESKLRKLRKDNHWDREWVVISKIVKATSSTILLSGSESAAVELRAATNLGPDGIDLARIGAVFR